MRFSENLSTEFATIDTEESQINITANQVLPNVNQVSTANYIADEGAFIFLTYLVMDMAIPIVVKMRPCKIST